MKITKIIEHFCIDVNPEFPVREKINGINVYNGGCSFSECLIFHNKFSKT